MTEGPKEVKKPNFRQYGRMEKKRWEESEKRKSQKKEDPGARQGSKAASRKICFFQCFVAPLRPLNEDILASGT